MDEAPAPTASVLQNTLGTYGILTEALGARFRRILSVVPEVTCGCLFFEGAACSAFHVFARCGTPGAWKCRCAAPWLCGAKGA